MTADNPAKPRKWSGYLVLMIATGMIAAAVACGGAATPVNTATPEVTPGVSPATVPAPTASPTQAATNAPVKGPVVRVDGTDFPVDLAVEPAERVRGLSGRFVLDPGTGMLFVFDFEDRFRFWMREMNFPLDIVWIGAECQVVDISENVPHPDSETSLNDLPRYSPSVPAMYVLEINGGESEALGLGAGDPVQFLGGLAGRFGC